MINTGTRGARTTHDVTRARSALVTDYAATLDSRKGSWSYNPPCFTGPAGRWQPDFRCEIGDVVHYVEIRPASFADGLRDRGVVDALLERMEVAWLSEPDAGLSLIAREIGRSVSMVVGECGFWFCSGDMDFAIWAGMGQHPDRDSPYPAAAEEHFRARSRPSVAT